MKKLFFIIIVINALVVKGQTGKEFYQRGNTLYEQGDFAGASKEYARALDMEKKKRTLDKSNFYVLIDNLGMAYGVSGKLKEAITTLEYGVSVDPNYPMFYYNLACCYGEQNDIDKTVHYLELAIKNKDNMFDGEEFPNPKEDDSFRKFVNDEKFKKAIAPLESGVGIDNLKLTNEEIPKGYSISKNSNCISIQACTFYDKPEIYEGFIGKLKSKDVQNFESSKDKGSIMYFEFEGTFKGSAFLGGLLWGGDKPTKEHPEEYFSKDNILIIWSFNNGSQIEKISQDKIKAILK